MKKRFLLGPLALSAMLATGCSHVAPDPATSQAQIVEAAKREGKVVVYSVLSNKAAAPLVNDFKSLYPDIKVEYDGESGSNETNERYKTEVAAGKESADVMWSSSMDLQMKLVADGYALPYRSPEAAKLPSWAVYRDLAYGTTYEPVVIVYNKARSAQTRCQRIAQHWPVCSLRNLKNIAVRWRPSTSRKAAWGSCSRYRIANTTLTRIACLPPSARPICAHRQAPEP